MAESVPRPATYEDLLAVPAPLVAEILHGHLVTHPRPAPKHARASSGLGMILGPPFFFGRGGPGGWVILDEPELHLGPHVVVPELAGWRRERMPRLPETAWFETAPDWACEVLSPSSARDDRVIKPDIYVRYGVGFYWLADPRDRTLETFEARDGVRWERTGFFVNDEQVIAPPFGEVPFSLGDLWMD